MSDYDVDVLAWSERQADLLRRLAAGERVNDADLDWTNIAEEIESVGRSERSALSSNIAIIIEHLMELEASPAPEPRACWQETIVRARGEIERLLEDSPSLRPAVAAAIAREHPRARRLAAVSLQRYGEKPRIDLSDVSYTEQQVLNDWFPGFP
jgi:hypothetical protein